MPKRIGELLIEAGAAAAEDVRRALSAQAGPKAGRRLGEILLEEQKVTPEALARALAVQFELPFTQLPPLRGPVSKVIPVSVQVQHRVVVFKVEPDGKRSCLHLALADPTRQELIDELQFQMATPIKVYVAAADDLERALGAIQKGPSGQPEPDDFETPSGTFELTEALEVTPLPFAAPPELAQALPLEWAEPAPPSATPAKVAVIKFDPRAKPLPREVEIELASLPPLPPAPLTNVASPASPPALEFSETDLKVLDSLERLARGEPPSTESEKVKPAQMVAALIRLLMKKGVIQELEFLEELSRK